MNRIGFNILPRIFLITFVLWGCTFPGVKPQHYKEIEPMLNVLTGKAQIAVEEGIYDKGGEKAVFAFINQNNPNVLKWFIDRNYDLKIDHIAEVAVVLVCDRGRPIFEDTFCKPGAPDKNHIHSSLKSCEITMSETDVAAICN